MLKLFKKKKVLVDLTYKEKFDYLKSKSKRELINMNIGLKNDIDILEGKNKK